MALDSRMFMLDVPEASLELALSPVDKAERSVMALLSGTSAGKESSTTPELNAKKCTRELKMPAFAGAGVDARAMVSIMTIPRLATPSFGSKKRLFSKRKE